VRNRPPSKPIELAASMCIKKDLQPKDLILERYQSKIEAVEEEIIKMKSSVAKSAQS